MHCMSCVLKRKVEKPLLFKQTLKSRFTCLACQHFSFDAKKSLDRERPFSLALRVVSLFSFLSRLAPSVTRVAIACLAFCSTDYRKKYPGYQRFFSRAAGIFGVWPKADTSSADKDLTETGNRARKVSGTQGKKKETLLVVYTFC